MEDVIAEMKRQLPSVFLGANIDELSGGIFNWRTIQNRRSRSEYENEDEIFFRVGNRVGVRRDPFLTSVAGTLSRARRLPVQPPRRGRRRDRSDDTQSAE
jgi:hypothetical protein